MKRILIIAALSLGAALTLGAQQPLHNDEAARAKQNLRSFPLDIRNYTLRSDILGEERCFSVYVPRSVKDNPDRKYPVAYILHGGGENDRQWANIPQSMVNEAITESVNGGEAQEMFIVFPDATTTKSGYMNQEGWRFEDFFFEELVPYIEAMFPVYSDRGHRAIGGLSMGGVGSIQYGLSHPEAFCAIYAMSCGHGGAIDSDASPSFGGLKLSDLSEAKLADLRQVKWILDDGNDDKGAMYGGVELYRKFQELGVPSEITIRDGGHATYFWYEGFTRALRFFSRTFDK